MKVLKREPLFEKMEEVLRKAYQHIPAELEYERKRKVEEEKLKPVKK